MKKIGKSKIKQGGGRIHQCIDKNGATPVEHSSELWRQFYTPNHPTRFRELSSANKSHLPVGNSSYQVKLDNPPPSGGGQFEKCSICGDKVRKGNMLRHKQTEHEKAIGVTRRKRSVNSRRKSQKKDSAFHVKCKLCNTDVNIQNLSNHMKKVHGIGRLRK